MQTTPSSNTGSVVASSITGVAGVSNAMPLRACTIPGCQVSKYAEVTKRKCYQFVSSPYIMHKPLVVNGRTSIFQVGGEMAKMGDLPSLSSATGGSGEGQPIYRIKPGTHAHVINYVFIDEGSDSLEKAKMEDQEAMRIMLESHRESASSKLQKLISMHRGLGKKPAAAAAATTAAQTSAQAATIPPVAANTVRITATQIHPNLSIASVEGASPFTTSTTNTFTSAPALSVALTQTTPALATTAASTVSSTNAPASAPVLASKPAPASVSVKGSTIEQLQAEILKLKRRVARLNNGKPS